MSNLYKAKLKKEKLVKWYGWLVLLLVCMTPLVIILLPKLMINVNKINGLLRESIIPETDTLEGNVTLINLAKTNDGGLGCIEGNIEIFTLDSQLVKCSFKQYVGPNYNERINLTEGDKVCLTGTYKDEVFMIKKIKNISLNQEYSSEPMVSVY